MRKMLFAAVMGLFAAGVVTADPVTLVKYNGDKKEVTFKDKDGKEATYKLTEKTKYLTIDKDGVKKDGDAERTQKVLASDKAAGKAKFDITVKDDEIVEIVGRGGKKN